MAANMDIEDSYNFRRISSKLTTSGLVRPDVLESLAAQGYDVVVNLLPDSHEKAVRDERAIVESQGLEYVHIPVDFKQPTRLEFEQFCETLDRLPAKKVHVHCAANYRVTAFYSLYEVRRGRWSVERAKEFMTGVWQPAEYPVWAEFISDLLAEGTVEQTVGGLKQAQQVMTRFPIESDLAAGTIKRLSDLINVVYDDAESGMFKRQGTRTNPADIERLLRARALILAELDGVIVGSVSVQLMNDGVGEFGMLAADLDHRGKGIGSVLVNRAEAWAREMGCHTMRLELLTPRNWTHPSKEFLKKWYSRIGYAPYMTEPLERTYPDLLSELATECDFTVWHKSLA